MPFTLTYSRLQSLAQDDTVLDEVEQTGDTILTGGLNAVSERKKLLCKFSVDTNADCQIVLAGSKLFVDWALFLPLGIALEQPIGPPATGFSVMVPETISDDADPDPIEMHFYSYGNPIADSGKNFRCFLYLYSETTFGIELEYYNTFDEDGYMNATPKNNEYRFISEHYQELNTDIVESSVYNTDKEIRLFTYISNDPAEICDTVGLFEKQEFRIYQGQISKYSNIVEVLDETAVEIEGFSSLIETPVIVKFYSDVDDVDNFYAKLIRIQNDQDLNFIENYELSEQEIVDGETPYDPGAFMGPFSVSWNAGGWYELGFYINPEFITDFAKYRIIIVGYNETETKQGIGIEVPAIGVPSYCGSQSTSCTDSYENPTRLLFTPTLLDIQKEWTGNFLTCCIEERMRAQLIIDYSSDRWKNNLDCRRNATDSVNDIRKYLSGIELEFYEEYTDTTLGGTVKNVFESKLIQRPSVNNYTYISYDPNLTFAFDLSNETLTLRYDFRNRTEASTPCLYSFLNGTPYLPVQGNQYWGGKTIFIKWRLSFYYHDFLIPFIDHLDVIQKIVVKDYSNDVTLTPVNDYIFFCKEEPFCFDASIILASPETYKLVNTFDWNGINESENFVPGELAQQTDARFTSQDVDYTGGDARFCFDPATLTTGGTYRFSAMAKKE